jgi:hypothetical protein
MAICNGKVPKHIITVNSSGGLEMQPIKYVKKDGEQGYIVQNYDPKNKTYLCKNLANHHNQSLTELPCGYIEELYQALKNKTKRNSTKKSTKNSNQNSTKTSPRKSTRKSTTTTKSK